MRLLIVAEAFLETDGLIEDGIEQPADALGETRQVTRSALFDEGMSGVREQPGSNQRLLS